ncbi:hypothetical protein ACFOU2_20695 [Bacillus songklensis]|uniref:Uracil DNA glycosylase superfamily protein n=1 Tax=Bacillus songklensis TaxID=1069116 RepID=A0ABV8B796_9BACI
MDLHYFASRILQLPDKEEYEKADLLTSSFLLHRKGDVSIFYAAHNEVVNEQAKVFIVGITPGWKQMERSIYTARKCLVQGLSLEETAQAVKKECRFFGSMRHNIIVMLNELELPSYLGIDDCEELFHSKEHLLHTTSLIKHPVFVNGKNYTGHNPSLLKENLFNQYLGCFFEKELMVLEGVLIIPLGKAVETVLRGFVNQKAITEKQCLFAFPHPSGANGHRRKQFALHKELLISKVRHFFAGD